MRRDKFNNSDDNDRDHNDRDNNNANLNLTNSQDSLNLNIESVSPDASVNSNANASASANADSSVIANNSLSASAITSNDNQASSVRRAVRFSSDDTVYEFDASANRLNGLQQALQEKIASWAKLGTQKYLISIDIRKLAEKAATQQIAEDDYCATVDSELTSKVPGAATHSSRLKCCFVMASAINHAKTQGMQIDKDATDYLMGFANNAPPRDDQNYYGKLSQMVNGLRSGNVSAVKSAAAVDLPLDIVRGVGQLSMRGLR